MSNFRRAGTGSAEHLTPAATAGKNGATFGTKGVAVLTVRLTALVMFQFMISIICDCFPARLVPFNGG